LTLSVLAVFLLTLAVTYSYAWWCGFEAGKVDGRLERQAELEAEQAALFVELDRLAENA
jgi:hypothetical protein